MFKIVKKESVNDIVETIKDICIYQFKGLDLETVEILK